MIIKNDPQNYNNRTNFKSKIYNNISEITKQVVNSFEPVYIRPPRFDNDIFAKNFADTAPKKRNYLHKFANLSEHYSLMYNVLDLKALSELALNKLKSLFLMASAKDEMGIIRFTPAQLLHVSTFSDDTLNFIRPFAHQKDYSGVFAYKFEDIIKLLSLSDEQKDKAMRLFKYNLPSDDLISICKDKNANITGLESRLKVINKIFGQNISDIGLKRYKNDYVLSLTDKRDSKVYKCVFDSNFNPNPSYMSNIDFNAGKLKNGSILKMLNLSKTKAETTVKENFRVSDKEHFQAIGKIVECAEFLKQKRLEIYKHNFFTLMSGAGHLVEAEIKFPDKMLANYWKNGIISDADLIKICTEYAELVPQHDFNYFALNKIKITPFDTEKYLEIRKFGVSSPAVAADSEYYAKVLDKTLQLEAEKLKNIKTQKRMIVIDGLPGAGKSSLIKSILKNDKNSFYTPDSDDIKTMFKEVYKNGEGAELVHKAAGKILKNEILPRVFEQGKNVIYQTTGNFVSINKIIQQAKNYGYTIDFIHVKTPKNLSLERTAARFRETGRFMDPLITISIFNNNNKEKMFAAKIFSHHKDVKNAYILENGKLHQVKDGILTGKVIET